MATPCTPDREDDVNCKEESGAELKDTVINGGKYVTLSGSDEEGDGPTSSAAGAGVKNEAGKKLSKAEKRQRRYEKILENRKRKRKDERARKKQRTRESNLTKDGDGADNTADVDANSNNAADAADGDRGMPAPEGSGEGRDTKGDQEGRISKRDHVKQIKDRQISNSTKGGADNTADDRGVPASEGSGEGRVSKQDQGGWVSAGDPAKEGRVTKGDHEGRISKRDQVKLIKDRQIFGKECGQRICIDLSLEQHMSKKECSMLAQQIGRLYGSNKKAEIPAHIILAGVDKSGHLYRECVRKNAGFENYILSLHETPHTELFHPGEVVYLSPDSPNVLDSVQHDKVYIIGGLVDETVAKNITQAAADNTGITTAKLPIDVYMDVDPRAKGGHNKVLTINQVFDILLTYVQTENWRTALPVGVPRRKGYILRSDI